MNRNIKISEFKFNEWYYCNRNYDKQIGDFTKVLKDICEIGSIDGRSREYIEDIWESMGMLLVEHFMWEDSIMEIIGYPLYSLHRMCHEWILVNFEIFDFIEMDCMVLNVICDMLESHKRYIDRLLEDWIYSHYVKSLG